MKKLMLLFSLATYTAKAQTAPSFKPNADAWMETATPTQLLDSAKATQVRYERAQRQINLLSATHEVRIQLEEDSLKRVRAAQLEK